MKKTLTFHSVEQCALFQEVLRTKLTALEEEEEALRSILEQSAYLESMAALLSTMTENYERLQQRITCYQDMHASCTETSCIIETEEKASSLALMEQAVRDEETHSERITAAFREVEDATTLSPGAKKIIHLGLVRLSQEQDKCIKRSKKTFAFVQEHIDE